MNKKWDSYLQYAVCMHVATTNNHFTAGGIRTSNTLQLRTYVAMYVASYTSYNYWTTVHVYSYPS